ncbi:DUF4397 domain-containing protein [Paucibacter sediminis]|uniref:DUF4397 domain-containing protein n=1 Tax=Paucibacter sediminis TaxID=3019553 RepID=A0AA95NHW9_9BURK|nr:DUF4397 domain-containing protein [Paucibacter sp. S2-9]WIT13442.1 DUF4397 domain-containing protein [Paucibacter sp. S2-9]
MRFKPWALGLAMAGASLLLSACGGGSSSGNDTSLRLLNASSGYGSLDLTVNSVSVNGNVAYANAGSYASVSTSATSSQVLASGVGTTVASTTPSLASGSHYSLIAYGWAGALHTTLLQEAETAADSGKSKLLVLNLATDAGALDVYVTPATDSLDNATPISTNLAGGSGSGYNSINAGSYRVRLTGYGNKSDVRLDIPSITLESTGVSTLLITATEGGVLVNGLHVKQQGAVTNYPGAVARARVVAAVSGNASVSGLLGDVSLLPTSVAPTIGEYKTVAAGSANLGLTVNGQAMAVASPNLKAGGDYTLLVWGDAAAPQLSVLADDNRLPTTLSTAKIRLINGVASLNTGLTMSVDYSAIATNVVPGTSSANSSIPSSTASLLSVSSPTSGTPVFSIASLPVLSSGVYSVFMMGGASNMLGTLRRER